MCGITIGGDVSIQISGPCVPLDGSVTAAKIGSGNAGDGQVLTADGNGGAAWETPAGGGPGYLKYVALLSQAGTDAPTATVLENTIGAIVWSRSSMGMYIATLTHGFPAGKVWGSILIQQTGDVAVMYFYHGDNDNSMWLLAYNASPGMGDTMDGWSAYIEIRVYP